MAATSIKLSDDLRRRIAALVEGTDKSAHAFMVEAIARETERAERRRQFHADARLAEEEAAKSGKTFVAGEVFDYLASRAAGCKARRPRTKAWRRSG